MTAVIIDFNLYKANHPSQILAENMLAWMFFTTAIWTSPFLNPLYHKPATILEFKVKQQ